MISCVPGADCAVKTTADVSAVETETTEWYHWSSAVRGRCNSLGEELGWCSCGGRVCAAGGANEEMSVCWFSLTSHVLTQCCVVTVVMETVLYCQPRVL